MNASVRLAIFVTVTMSFAILSYAGAAPEINLARGKPYTLSPAPNYRPCIGPSDVTDLTDGVVYTGPEQLWQRQGCVGWIVQGKPVVITLDLGQIEPIKGVSYHTAAGRAGVYWPSLINLQFSDDGKTYHDAGDLVEQDQSPKPQAYGSGNYYYHTYRTDALAAKGRYVRLSIITEGSFVFCDEIEVYRGADELLQRTMPGEGLDAAHSADAILLGVTRSGVRHRLRADLALVRSAVEKEAPTNAKPEMMSDLDSLQKRIGAEQYPASLDGFRAILPLGDLDAKIFAVYGRLLAAKKIEPLTLWHTPPYQMLQVLQTPGESAKGLQVRMMQNEHRAQAFNITNASGEPRQVHFAIKGLDGNDNPAWVQVSQVEYVDALPGGRYKEAIQSHPVAAALVPLAAEQGHYVTTVPAGMTRQIWLSVDSRNLGAGTRSGVIQLNAQGVSRRLPLEVVIAPVKMADEKALNVSTWDYIFDQMYGITAGNRAAAAKDLAAHSISPWCASSSTPLPKVGDFDSQGNLTGRINYARWDSFVKFWPGARHYFAFPAFMPQSTFGGFKMGTPQCDRAI